MRNRKILLLSFDDGTIYDKRFTELLNRYGIPATFNLNSGLEDFVWHYEDRFPVRRQVLAGTVDQYQGESLALAQSVLLRCGDHSAAVVAAVERGSDPYLAERVVGSIHSDFGVGRLIAAQQTAYSDGAVVHILVGLAQFVADFTAVAVNAESDSVDETVALSFYLNRREILQIAGDGNRSGARLYFDVAGKVVSGADGEVENVLCNGQIRGVIGETIQSAVSTGEDQVVICIQSL